MLGPESDWPVIGPPAGWAHATVAISLRSVPEVDGSQDPDDRPKIEELSARYGWYLDERRLDLLRDFLVDDVEWDGAPEAGQALGPVKGRDNVLRRLAELYLRGTRQRRHLCLNAISERETSSEVACCSYFLLTSARDGVVELNSSGFHRFQFVRDESAWRIRRLFTGFDARFWPEDATDLTGHLHELFGAGSR